MRPPLFVLLVAAVMASGCALQREENPDLSRIPDGPAEVVGGGIEPIGPVTVVAEGTTSGIGWRYSVFESTDGMCMQLETVRFATSGCGQPEPRAGLAFGSVATGETGAGFTTVDGTVIASASSVQVETTDGRRVDAEVISLERAGLELRAFVAFLREDERPRRAIAIGSDGEVLGTTEMP